MAAALRAPRRETLTPRLRPSSPPPSPTTLTHRKRNPIARLLSRHGGLLALLLMAALAVTGVAFAGQAKACRAATGRLAALEAEHGVVKHTGDRTRELADAKAREAATLASALEDARKEARSATERATERERRVVTLEAELVASHKAHGGAAADAAVAAGLRAELDIQKARVEGLTRELVDAKRALEVKEAERAAAVAGHGGGHDGGGDHAADHTGFLQVAKLLEEQGVKDPRGAPALAATLAKFFEDQMVRGREGEKKKMGRFRERGMGWNGMDEGKRGALHCFPPLNSHPLSLSLFPPPPAPPQASAMAKFEQGGGGDPAKAAPHASSHDISTQLITLLSGLGVTSEHGLDHLFTTVDHLVDAALTHWGPGEGAEEHTGGVGAAAAAHHGGEPHPAPVPGGDAAHPAHADPAHPAHADPAHPAHAAAAAGAAGHAAEHGHGHDVHADAVKAGHQKTHVDASGFVMR